MNDGRSRLVAQLTRFPAELEAAARAAALRPVAAGEWSPCEVVRHLVAVDEEVFQRRLDELATQDQPRWSWVEPRLWSGPGDEALEGALAAFVARRTATIRMLAALDEAGWGRWGTHAVYGVLDVAGLLRIAVDHDREHLAQILAPADS